MNIVLSVENPTWRTVYTITKGTHLQKGRHGIYHEIIKATQSITQRFGCYSWKSQGMVYYCGSFAKDNKRKEFQTNLQGRIHNYWQNHRKDTKTGRQNTNRMVFEKIGERLKYADVELCILAFDALRIGDRIVSPESFADDHDLVHAVEELLICSHRKQEQCAWNRT